MVYFPDEVIVEILLRLPVKSLLRFRSVSKSWLSLISDPQFAKSHFELGYARTDRLIYKADSEVLLIDFEAPFHDDSAVIRLNISPRQSGPLSIMGSCKGLLLFRDYPYLLVWNPSTRVHKHVPYPYSAIAELDIVHKFLFGFGYDPSTDDFLIVIASCAETYDEPAQFEFFSLKNNSWKKVVGDGIFYMDHMDSVSAGTLFNGAIHWIAFRVDVYDPVIVVFDLTERSLRELSLPDTGLDIGDCELVVLGGFLCVCIHFQHIWVMIEYGVQSSWKKLDYNIPTTYYLPICLSNSGCIVGTAGGTALLRSNHNGELLEHREYCDDPHVFRKHKMALYTESLLTLPLGEAREDRQP